MRASARAAAHPRERPDDRAPIGFAAHSVTTLLTRPTGAGPRHRDLDGTAPAYRVPTTTRRWRPLLAAVSAIAVFGSIGLFAALYSSASRQTQVLVVTQTVQQGQPLLTSNLGQAWVAAGPGVAAIPVGRASQVLGKVAAVTITSGALLTPADVSSVLPIAPGDAVVGLALKEGQLPAGGVGPGDQVMVVETGASGSPLTSFVGSSGSSGSGSTSASAASAGSAGISTPSSSSAGSAAASGGESGPSGVLVPDATVFETGSPGAQSSGNFTELVSIEVANTVAPAVTAAGAADQVSLVLVPADTAGPAALGSGGTGSNGSASTSKASGTDQRTTRPVRPSGAAVRNRQHARPGAGSSRAPEAGG